MKRILIASIVLCVAGAAQAADSPCKGLDEAQCGKTAGCTWQVEQVKGQPSASTGKPYKRNMKAHCRKPFARSEAASAKPAKGQGI